MADPKKPLVTPGQVVPNIAALQNTTADWVYTNGMWQPPMTQSWAPMSTASFTVPFGRTWSFRLGPHPSVDYSMPKPLPNEQREMPVVGYRAWNYSGKFRLGHGRQVVLGSTGVGGHWKAGANKAICTTQMGHRAPDENCACGYYVLASLDQVEDHVGITDGVVVGAVMGWGRVVQHGSEGWRAEYAKIIALLDCKFSKGQFKNTEAAAEAYGVEVKDRRQLEAMVSEFGDPFAEGSAA